MRTWSFLTVVVFALTLFSAGCSPNRIIGEGSESIAPAAGKKSVVHFSINFNNAEFLAKVANIGDGLTIAERKAILEHLKSRLAWIQLCFYNCKDNSATASFFSTFYVNAGVCEGDMQVDTGFYHVYCYSGGKILVGTDSVNVGDFNYFDSAKISSGDTIKLNIALKANDHYSFGLLLKDGITPLNGSVDSLMKQQDVVAAHGGQPTAVNGYVAYVEFYPVKKSLTFFCGGKKYTGVFDITRGLDDDIVEMSVAEIKLTVADFSVSFADDALPVVTSVYPAEGAINVPCDISYVVAHFNKYLAEYSDMPGAQFGVASEDGSDQVTGTYSLSSNFFARNMDNGVTRVYLKPNTKYIARVSAVKDKYGYEMAGEKRWSFTTGAN